MSRLICERTPRFGRRRAGCGCPVTLRREQRDFHSRGRFLLLSLPLRDGRLLLLSGPSRSACFLLLSAVGLATGTGGGGVGERCAARMPITPYCLAPSRRTGRCRPPG